MSRKKHYRVFEGLRVATFLTFISGYLNAFTFVTQGGRFAGVQSGNVISWAYYLALGDLNQVFNFTIPILFFVLGQFFTYLARKWFLKSPYSWHFGSSVMMTILVILAVILTPVFPNGFTMAILAFVASIQVETFRKLRGASYANVMMTGNVKNAAYLWFMGMMEKDKDLQKRGRNIFFIILSFMFGVIISTRLSLLLGEYALSFVLIPLLYINIQLWYEKKS
ncbi:YoaK family protein [Streptococcus ovis]|uniref:YoaK family protein n=1 Tax=Streptococcus ovis TaxID=82806 RepID=UPI00036AB7C7|nr:YoaK family protein [Streptococcus ovis]